MAKQFTVAKTFNRRWNNIVGEIFEGTITGVKDFGAFVSLPNGQNALVHISQVSNSYIKDLNRYFEIGQKVSVKVIGIDENGKISLSMKQAQEAEKSNQNQPPKPELSKDLAFEQMLTKFKKTSDEKMNQLKKSSNSRMRCSKK